MCRRKHTKVKEKVNSSSRKRGFTIVELTIALALLAIFTSMVVSFSVLMKESATDSSAEYGFLEDAFTIKEEVTKWAAEEDYTGADIDIVDGKLTANGKAVKLENGVLTLGEKSYVGLGDCDGIAFTSHESGELIKCRAFRVKENGQVLESVFVFALRCATAEEVTDAEQ